MTGIRAVHISGKSYHGSICHPNSTNATDRSTSDLVEILWNFVAPVIFVVGLIGNLLILAVMTRTWMRGTSTGSYLIAMAVADLFVLVSGMIPEYLEAIDIVTFKEIHPLTCKLEKFVFYTAGDTAIWIRVLFTVDRFVAVCLPMSTFEFCLYWKAKYYSLAAFLAATAKNFHVLFTRGAEFSSDADVLRRCHSVLLASDFSNNSNISVPTTSSNATIVALLSNCGGTSPANKYFETFVRPWIAFSLVSLLPFVIILVLSLLIIRSLVEAMSSRVERMTVTRSHDRHIWQMTAMSLSASFSFLVCVTPSMILLIGKPYWKQSGVENPAYDIAKAINNQLYYVVHSVNFFLYCISGRRFRDSLRALCVPGRRYSTLSSSIRASVYSAGMLTRNSLTVSTRRSSGTDLVRVKPKDTEARL